MWLQVMQLGHLKREHLTLLNTFVNNYGKLLWSLKKKRKNKMSSVNALSVFTVMKMAIDRVCWV